MSAAKKVAISQNLKASWVAVPVSKLFNSLQRIMLTRDLGFAALKQFTMTHTSLAQESKHAKFLMKSHTAHYSTIQTFRYRIVAMLLLQSIRRIPYISSSMTLKNSASK